ncbi:histidine--tRNA ligase [Candidatus Saccharibacteria bacterium]|nr:histidine--tRNA ligase [Candidatus Saccharibacteria bacterium]
MKKINTSPISGMQEFLPDTQATFNKLKAKIGEVYHRHGFLNIETPTIDRLDILLAKAGGDTEKQIYKVIKTAEASDDADQGLRFDHTVPLARYVVEHENDLTFPFKVSQIGRNFRGERAQKGRFREFYQCDVDVIGRESLSLFYDSDVISTLLDAYDQLELDTPVLVRISNRKILTGFLRDLQVIEKSGEIYNIIDHSEKVTPEETKGALVELGLADGIVAKILKLIDLHGNREEVINGLNEFAVRDEMFTDGVSELEQVMGLLEADGLGKKIEADMKIVRGLDYYTGTVFEFCLPEYKQIGSVGGGGRYDNLAGYFTEQKLPGVGGSIGLSRFFYILSENNLIKNRTDKPVDYAIIPISDEQIDFALKVAKRLRGEKNSVAVVYMDKKLGDKLNYAAKIAKNGIVIGEDEVASGDYKVKTFN